MVERHNRITFQRLTRTLKSTTLPGHSGFECTKVKTSIPNRMSISIFESVFQFGSVHPSVADVVAVEC